MVVAHRFLGSYMFFHWWGVRMGWVGAHAYVYSAAMCAHMFVCVNFVNLRIPSAVIQE